MKTIFLSMLTIAALASCTRQDFIDPNDGTDPGGTGESMVVELTVSSTQLTKADGAPDNAKDKAINDITVFGVNKGKNSVISRQFFALTGSLESPNVQVQFKTTNQTDAIYVIANVGADLTGPQGALNLSTVKALNNAMASLIIPNPQGHGDKVAKQEEGKVLMSGYTSEVKLEAGSIVDKLATAEVQLNLIASKVILKEITRISTATGVYGTNYKFVGAMMANVNTQAYYFADQYPLLEIPSYIGMIASPNDRPVIDKVFMSGAPADQQAGPGLEKASVLYQDLTTKAQEFESTKTLTNIAYWYVFENNEEASGKPTALQLHYQWKSDQQETPQTDKYISVVFGNGIYPSLVPGKAYSVSIQFDSNLTDQDAPPGGDTPDEPTLEGEIGVTVTPAEWADGGSFDKPIK